jgi:hypothetical protein
MMDITRKEAGRPGNGARSWAQANRDEGRAIRKRERQAALRELRSECDDMNQFAKKLCEDGTCVSMSQGRRMFLQLGE